MRLDYTLYALAVVFFAITIVSAVSLTGTDQTIWIVTSGLLGILSLSLGFIQRPKSTTQTNQPSPTPATATPAPQPTETATVEAQKEEEKSPPPTVPATETPAIETLVASIPVVQEPVATEVQPPMPEQPANPVASQEANEPSIEHALTEVSGIGEKRASQLKALGINSVDDLAKASIEDLAKSLKTSPKIVAKWVASAKQLLQK
jgi:predicted flap endonuclease-1-like 5' DNA nuclease